MSPLFSSFLWIAVSTAYLALILLLAFCLKKHSVSSEISRKCVHILLSLWIFIPVYFIPLPLFRLVGPVAFIFINWALVKSGKSEAVGIGSRGYGLIFFPLSLAILLLLFNLGLLSSFSAIAGSLVMGFGDSSASLVGLILHKDGKSFAGSATMCFVTMVALSLFTPLSLPFVALVAVLLALIERVSPFGFDNLTVPLATSFLVETICVL